MPGLESLSLVDRDPENPRDWECEWGEVEQWCEVLTTKVSGAAAHCDATCDVHQHMAVSHVQTCCWLFEI
jgi:hypothetical protein